MPSLDTAGAPDSSGTTIAGKSSRLKNGMRAAVLLSGKSKGSGVSDVPAADLLGLSEPSSVPGPQPSKYEEDMNLLAEGARSQGTSTADVSLAKGKSSKLRAAGLGALATTRSAKSAGKEEVVGEALSTSLSNDNNVSTSAASNGIGRFDLDPGLASGPAVASSAPILTRAELRAQWMQAANASTESAPVAPSKQAIDKTPVTISLPLRDVSSNKVLGILNEIFIPQMIPFLMTSFPTDAGEKIWAEKITNKTGVPIVEIIKIRRAVKKADRYSNEYIDIPRALVNEKYLNSR